MNQVNSDVLNEIISYLKLSEIKKLGICSRHTYETCKKMIPYSYSQHGGYEHYVKMNNIRWMIDECCENRLNNAIVKRLDIYSICFDSTFNQPVEALSHCTHLQQITFGNSFNQSLDALTKCTNLRQITFGLQFNKSIEALSHCTNLQQIIFGHAFNQPIETLATCTNLRQITFGGIFNQSIESLSNCKNLEQITFSVISRFNQPIEALSYCTNLQQVTFGYWFEQSIEALAKCTNLRQITLCGGFQPTQATDKLFSCNIVVQSIESLTSSHNKTYYTIDIPNSVNL